MPKVSFAPLNATEIINIKKHITADVTTEIQNLIFLLFPLQIEKITDIDIKTFIPT